MSTESESEIIKLGTASFVDAIELHRRAEGLAHAPFNGIDDSWAGVAWNIACYKPPHATALVARVCALLDKYWRGRLAWVCAEVATDTYRPVRDRLRGEQARPSRDPMRDAIFHLGQYQAYRIRSGAADVHAAVAWNIADNPAPAAVAVAAEACVVLNARERETFAAVAAQVAFGRYRSVTRDSEHSAGSARGYGAIARTGTRDDEEKPKFESLRPGQRMDDVTLEQAPERLQSPRTLGQMPDGQPITVTAGRVGPFAHYGNRKYVLLKNEDNPYTVTLERALQLLHEKRESEAREAIRAFDGTDVRVVNGRYGPYVTDGTKNGRIPKDRDPKTLTLEECQAILAAAPEK